MIEAKEKQKKISVVGAGQWGFTLAILASKNVQEIFIFDRNHDRAARSQQSRYHPCLPENVSIPQNSFISGNLEQCLLDSSLIVVAVPSNTMRQTARNIAQYISLGQYIVHGTKGFESNTCKRMSEVLTEETGIQRIGTISGPNLAKEILSGYPAGAVIASAFSEVRQRTNETFKSDTFAVFETEDLSGVEWVSSLKNIMAIWSGVLFKMNLGENAKAFILSKVMNEISLLIGKLGGKQATLLSLAGIGDIIATCSSNSSRNFQAGTLLASGQSETIIQKSLNTTIEGFSTIKAATNMARQFNLNLETIALLESLLSPPRNLQQSQLTMVMSLFKGPTIKPQEMLI